MTGKAMFTLIATGALAAFGAQALAAIVGSKDGTIESVVVRTAGATLGIVLAQKVI